MALVTFKDLLMDVEDPASASERWGQWLNLRAEADAIGAVLRGENPEQTIWVNPAEPQTVKNRVHLDLFARDLSAFEDLTRVTSPGQFPWTVFLDPEGLEFCVFESADRPVGLKDVVVDAIDHQSIATWWAELFGGTFATNGEYSWVDDIAGAPVESFDFPPVPEGKTVKNRLHWEVNLAGDTTVDDLVSRGATVLLPQGDDRAWTVMADPEGNEFCVFGN